MGIYSEGEKTREQMIALYKEFVANYPLVSLEDPLHEEDMEGHAIVTQETGIEIVGDDLFTTNIERVKMGVEMGAANSMVLKITQVGTVSEALDAARLLPAATATTSIPAAAAGIATASPTLPWGWARARCAPLTGVACARWRRSWARRASGRARRCSKGSQA